MSIRIAAITGTVRPGNFTSKALALVVDELEAMENVEVDLIDPATMRLSLPGQKGGDDAPALQERVKSATGVILSTPEYHGSYSAAIKMVIENLGFPSVLAGKPIALLGVAAGQIGAIKSLESLRGVCSHVGAIVLPGPVSVAGVQGIFDEAGRCTDERAEKRIRGLARSLVDYIQGSICPKLALEAMVRGEVQG
jgi:chromate reductase